MLSPVIILIYILPVPQETITLSHPVVLDITTMPCPACTKTDNEDIQISKNLYRRYVIECLRNVN